MDELVALFYINVSLDERQAWRVGPQIDRDIAKARAAEIVAAHDGGVRRCAATVTEEGELYIPSDVINRTQETPQITPRGLKATCRWLPIGLSWADLAALTGPRSRAVAPAVASSYRKPAPQTSLDLEPADYRDGSYPAGETGPFDGGGLA